MYIYILELYFPDMENTTRTYWKSELFSVDIETEGCQDYVYDNQAMIVGFLHGCFGIYQIVSQTESARKQAKLINERNR